MRYLLLLFIVFIVRNNIIAQRETDTHDLKLMYLPDVSNLYIGGVDSLDIFITSASSRYSNLSKGTPKLIETIEPHGYRGADGILYTMRIKVPEDNYAARREYDWNPQLDSLDSKMIYPIIKKK